MRHKTIAQFEEAVRQHCRACQCTKRLVTEHCTAATCLWFDDRAALIERTLQLSLFTYSGFRETCYLFLSGQYGNMPSEMWWSDIRVLLGEHIKSLRAMQPPARWWSNIAQEILPQIGWARTQTTRVSPINRAREYLYEKS